MIEDVRTNLCANFGVQIFCACKYANRAKLLVNAAVYIYLEFLCAQMILISQIF